MSNGFYFDTNALFKYYHTEKGSLALRRLIATASKPILVSSLTVVECFAVIMEYYRKGELKKKQVNDLYKRLDKDVGPTEDTNRPFQMVVVPEGTFQLAKNILLQHAYTFRVETTDALHLAIVKRLSRHSLVKMVTSDQSMQRVYERLSIPVYDPENEGT